MFPATKRPSGKRALSSSSPKSEVGRYHAACCLFVFFGGVWDGGVGHLSVYHAAFLFWFVNYYFNFGGWWVLDGGMGHLFIVCLGVMGVGHSFISCFLRTYIRPFPYI